MINFAHLTIPVVTARQLAMASDARTVSSASYAVKSALRESFGEHAVVPWRLLDDSDGVYSVLGVVSEPERVRPSAASRRLGIVVETIDWDPPMDEAVTLDVLATPVKRITLRDPKTGARERTIFADVSVRREDGYRNYVPATGDDQKVAYAAWLVEAFSQENRGMAPTDVPTILSTRPVREIRKQRGETSTLRIPCVSARVDVRIRDKASFETFLRTGLKKLKDVGLGAVIPLDVLESVAA